LLFQWFKKRRRANEYLNQSNFPIWRIKYQPNSLDTICGRTKIIERLKGVIEQRNFPHLLFVGSEGIGKTTIARLFAKGFLGQFYDTNYKIVYADVPLTEEERKQASSGAYISKSKIGSMAGRRITTPAFIRVKVKPFVELKALGDVPFKILIVKNFEKLGGNQQGFRRLMEKYGSNCRMILITTKISGIIDPIASRCQLVLISQANIDSFSKLIKELAEKESLKIEDDAIGVLHQLSQGNISRAIDLLQMCAITGNKVDLNALYESALSFENEMVKSLLMMSLKGDFPKARELARKIVKSFKYSSHELFNLILNELRKLPLSKFTRSTIINLIADADIRALNGIDDDIQISALLSKICLFSESL
jgi:replication factor C small subunit